MPTRRQVPRLAYRLFVRNMHLEFDGRKLFGHSGGFVGFVAAPFRILATNEIMVGFVITSLRQCEPGI